MRVTYLTGQSPTSITLGQLIVKGDKGDKGDTGDQGPQGEFSPEDQALIASAIAAADRADDADASARQARDIAVPAAEAAVAAAARIDLGELDAAVAATSADRAQTAIDRAQVATDRQGSETNAARAEAAASNAAINANVYLDIATGRAAVADGEQFQVLVGDEYVRYRRDSSTTQTEVGRYPSAGAVADVRRITDSALYPTPQLFDKRTAAQGQRLDPSNGTLIALAGAWTSDYIAVQPGLNYCFTYPYYVVFFSSKSPAGYVSGTAAATNPTVAPGGAAWMRITGRTPLGHDIDRQMVSQSASPLPWAPFGGFVNGAQIRNLPATAIPDDTITPQKTTFLSLGKNLFDKNDPEVIRGSFMSASGSIIVNAAYYVSGKIPAVAGQQYLTSGPSEPQASRFLTAFHASDQPIAASGSDSTVGGWTAPVDGSVAYYRFSGWISNIDDMMVEAGSTRTAFEPYRYQFAPNIYTGGSEGGIYEPDLINQAAMRRSTLFRARRAAGTATRLSITAVGDSYTQAQDRWTGKAALRLIADYGDGGGGWTGYGFFSNGSPPYVLGGSQPSGINGNVRPSLYGLRYRGNWVASYSNSPSPDCSHISSSTPGDMIERTVPAAPNHSALRMLFVATADGVVRHRVDGGTWTTVNVQGTVGNIGHFDIPLTNGAHTIEIEVVSGMVSLCGDGARSSTPGIVLNKCGASGSRVSQWAGQSAAQQQAAWALLETDVFVLMDGTNSQGNAVPFSAWRTDMSTLVTRFRAAIPFPDVMIVMPPENMRGLSNAMALYSAQGRSLAQERSATFKDLQLSFGVSPADYASTSGFPLFHPDGVHPDTNLGGSIMELEIRRGMGLA